ncbi:hypothetical protein KAI87_14275, partial [Myxococcota bacterium]|nr:hypothetical protein [Myxococcota bacterium]
MKTLTQKTFVDANQDKMLDSRPLKDGALKDAATKADLNKDGLVAGKKEFEALYSELDKLDDLDTAKDPKSLTLTDKDGVENKKLTSLLDDVSQATSSNNMGRRYEAVVGGSEALKKETLAATIFVKLQEGDLISMYAQLDAELPPEVMAKVQADPALSNITPKIETYSDYLRAIIVDAGGNDKLDLDLFSLARMIKGNETDTQQKIQDALIAKIPLGDMNRGLEKAGFKHTLTEADLPKAKFTDPALAGTQHPKSDMGRIQQQFLRAIGVVFVDENKDNKMDASDLVRFTDELGRVKTQSFGEFKKENPSLVKVVLHDIANAEAMVDYNAQWRRIRFPAYSSSTRSSDPERVNDKFWALTVSASKGTYWDLAEDITPSQSLNDVMVD